MTASDCLGFSCLKRCILCDEDRVDGFLILFVKSLWQCLLRDKTYDDLSIARRLRHCIIHIDDPGRRCPQSCVVHIADDHRLVISIDRFDISDMPSIAISSCSSAIDDDCTS